MDTQFVLTKWVNNDRLILT